jgi:hypothetical protein
MTRSMGMNSQITVMVNPGSKKRYAIKVRFLFMIVILNKFSGQAYLRLP